ncbi:MAG: hypothetical protein RL653_1241 [Pseudomonadota bacterium]|jgi:hypothetical protein
MVHLLLLGAERQPPKVTMREGRSVNNRVP